MNNKLYNKLRGICLFALPLFLVAGMVACSDSPTMTERFEATGELQGQVIDRSTGDAVSDVSVTLLYREEDSEGNLTEDFEDTRTTDNRGRFSFKNVPVNTDGKGSENGDRKSLPYMLQLDTNGNENYRSSYLAEVDVVFESTGGDGAAVNMTSNVTIPLSKRSVEVGGKVVSQRDTNEPFEGATVEIYQMFDPVVNGNGGTSSQMYLTSTNTNGSGEFTFSNVEESAQIFFRVKDDSDNTNVVNWRSNNFNTPSSSDGSAGLDVGTFNVNGQDQSSKFNVTVIGKAVQQSTEAPLEGVSVYLKDGNFTTSEIVDSTMTTESGNFEFTNVEEGQSMQLVFKKLDDENEVYDQTFGAFTTPSVRGESTITEDLGNIELTPQDRSGAFYVVSISPEDGADLESSELSFVYEFNRPVAANEYTRTDLGFGNGTFKDDIMFNDGGPKKQYSGDLNFDVEWSEGRDVLTITPDPDDLRDANEYTLFVRNALMNNNFTDENGKDLETGQNFPFSSTFDYNIEFSINDNNAVPHTPNVTLADGFDEVDWNAIGVNIEWTADESEVDVKQYEVWRSENSEPFEHLYNVDPNDFAFGEITRGVFFNNNELVNRRSNVADSPKDVRIRVRAISANLVEGEYSDIITVVDNIAPEVDGATQNSPTVLTINFNEPMDRSSVEGGTYTFLDGAGDEVEVDIESVEYQIGTGAGNPRVVITLDEDSDNDFTDAEEVEVEGATDLAGNELDEDENSAGF